MVVLLWASAIAAISIASTLWARSALRGVSVEVAFEPSRAFVGEDVTLRVRIANEKRLPLPIVRLLVRYPFGLLPDADPDPIALRGHRQRTVGPPALGALDGVVRRRAHQGVPEPDGRTELDQAFRLGLLHIDRLCPAAGE